MCIPPDNRAAAVIEQLRLLRERNILPIFLSHVPDFIRLQQNGDLPPDEYIQRCDNSLDAVRKVVLYISRRAQVSPAAIYAYFDDLDDLQGSIVLHIGHLGLRNEPWARILAEDDIGPDQWLLLEQRGLDALEYDSDY